MGIISIVVLGIATVVCIIIYPNFNILFNVFSDFGYWPQTAAIFNSGLIAKGILDAIFIVHIFDDLKIQDWKTRLFLFVPMVSTLMIGIFPKFPLRPIHWFFVILAFVSFTLMQNILAKKTQDREFLRFTNFFITLEYILLIFIFPSDIFWGIGEVLQLILFVTWLWRFQRQLHRF
jgi:hypothetical membrane protein